MTESRHVADAITIKRDCPPPIFIVGAPRSGTTLLRFMLCSHPRIFIPPESYFIPRLFSRRPTVPLKRRRAIRAVRFMLEARPFIKDWRANQPEPEQFVAQLPDLQPATLLDSLYCQYASQHGAERWGDKTPTYTGYMDLIARIFPRAQFLHIIRDGRDVAVSTIETYQKHRFYVDIYFAARTWDQRVRKALADGNNLGPDRYYCLRYEDLVVDAESSLREICEFLDEPFVADMLQPHKLARNRISATKAHAAVRQPITTSSVARWHQELGVADQRLFQAIAGGLLDELGYGTVDLGAMSLPELARLALLRSKYIILESGRCILQALGILDPH